MSNAKLVKVSALNERCRQLQKDEIKINFGSLQRAEAYLSAGRYDTTRSH